LVHSPVEFRQSVPAGQLLAEQGVGRQLPVTTSQNELLSQLCKQGAFAQMPCTHT